MRNSECVQKLDQGDSVRGALERTVCPKRFSTFWTAPAGRPGRPLLAMRRAGPGRGTARSTALTNGSWSACRDCGTGRSDDPYSAALALQSLASARPNPTGSIHFFIQIHAPERRDGHNHFHSPEHRSGRYIERCLRFFLGGPSSPNPKSGAGQAGGMQLDADQVIPAKHDFSG